MKTTLDKETFVNTFDQYGRGDNFSRAAREALFDYYEQYEEDTGEDIEFDCIAICCDWSEYESALDACSDIMGDCPFEEEDEALEYLRDETQVIEFDGGILVMAF